MSDDIRVLRLMTRANLGGPARQMRALAEVLPSQGVRQLWCFGATRPEETELGGLGKVLQPPQCEAEGRDASGKVRLAEFGKGMDPGGDLLTLRALLRLVKSFEPELIHTHTAKAGILGAAVAAKTGLPLLHSYHGHVLLDYFGARRSALLQRAERALCKRRVGIHCVSESCAQELVDLGLFSREKCTVIPPLLDPSSLEPETGREEARRILSMDPDEWALAWVGRLVPVKDPELLIATLESLVQIAPERSMRVHVFGTGPLEPRIRQAVSSLPIVLHGARPDLPRLLKAFDLMLSTSRREGFPLSVLEALAQGVPVVGPRVPGLVDLIGPGLSLCSRDASSLARACFGPQAVPASRAQALRRDHHPATLAPRYAELYRNLLA